MAGGRIELVSLTKRFTEVAVDCIDLDVTSGEFFSLLGPSGCGKTTTLRLIAGFEQPTEGSILLDGVDVSAVPPHKRNVNTVFQSYALFPFLTVLDNVAFGLRNRKLPADQIRSRVSQALELVSLAAFAKRRPGQLSGGQQQRVALARALVLQPAVLLLDEPLGALDAKLRRSLKVELKALQEEVGITFLYVTHDQEEALTMSDRLAVMRDGKIVQIGLPHEVYEEPADTYVADFLGVSNLMPIRVVGARPGRALPGPAGRDGAHGRARRSRRAGPGARGDQAGAGPGGGVRLGRPEPGAGHGRAAGLPGLGHPGDPAPGGRARAAGAAAERRRPGSARARYPGAGVPAPRGTAGAGRRRPGGRRAGRGDGRHRRVRREVSQLSRQLAPGGSVCRAADGGQRLGVVDPLAAGHPAVAERSPAMATMNDITSMIVASAFSAGPPLPPCWVE